MQRILCVLFLAMSLSACDVPRSPDAFAKTPEAQFLRSIVEKLKSRDFASIEQSLEPGQSVAEARVGMQEMAASLPTESELSVVPVAWQIFTATGSPRLARVAAEYSYPSSKWFVVSAQLVGEPGNFKIRGFHVNPEAASLAEINDFKLQGKGFVQYLFFLLAVCACLLCGTAFVICLLTKNLKRKWLWAIFTLVGFCAVTVNWTSGAVSLNLLSMNFLSAGYVRAGWVGPWAITFAIPVGALVFLWKHVEPTATEPAVG